MTSNLGGKSNYQEKYFLWRFIKRIVEGLIIWLALWGQEGWIALDDDKEMVWWLVRGVDSQTFPGWIHPGRHARTYSSMKNPYFPKSSSSSTSLRGGITLGRQELTCSCGGIIHTFLSHATLLHCHTAVTLSHCHTPVHCYNTATSISSCLFLRQVRIWVFVIGLGFMRRNIKSVPLLDISAQLWVNLIYNDSNDCIFLYWNTV